MFSFSSGNSRDSSRCYGIGCSFNSGQWKLLTMALVVVVIVGGCDSSSSGGGSGDGGGDHWWWWL